MTDHTGTAPFGVEQSLEAVRSVALTVAAQQTVPEIVAAIAEGLQNLPGRPAATVGVAFEDEPLRLMSLDGFDPSTMDRWGTIDRNAPVPFARVLETGEAIHVESIGQMTDEYPLIAEEARASRHRSWLAVPLLSEVGPSGVIGLAWDHERTLSETERLFLLTLAKLGGEALRRASREIDRRDLALLLADASDDERARIARDLHDESVQRLAAASMQIGSLRLDLTDQVSAGLVAARLEMIESEVQRVIQSLRDIIVGLHPPEMSHLSLVQAITDLAEWLFRGQLHVEVDDELGLSMSRPETTTIFRIVAEALSNVARHADATGVQVRLVRTDTAGVRLVVTDDGRGMSGSSEPGPGHIGLRMLRSRVEAAGGDLTISDDGGVRVEAQIPLHFG